MSESARPTLDEVIDSRPLSGLQIGVAVACALVAFVDGYDIQTMALATPSIAEEWGVSRESFGWVLSGSLWGMVISAFAAPLGDRLGRVRTLAASLIVIGLSSIGTAYGGSHLELFFWRVLTGVGLGACLANATALTSEFAPARRRAALMTLMGCNVGLGALTASLVAPEIIAAVGWRGVFWVGGAAPLAMAALFLAVVPDSPRLLAVLRPGDPAIAKTMSRIAPGQAFSTPEPAPRAHWSAPLLAVATLLRPPYRQYTWRLWLVYSCSSLALYLLISWLPVLLSNAGWTPANALRGVAAFQLGGVAGAVVWSVLVDRGRPLLALLLAYAVASIGVALFAVTPASGLAWSLNLALAGAGVIGATFAVFAVAAMFYPPKLRAAGFGWIAGVARFGAILGPILGGELLKTGLEPRYVVATLVGPALVCVLATLTLVHVLAGGPPRRPPSSLGAST